MGMESNFIVLFGSALIIRAQLCVVAGVMSWKRWLVCTTVETLPCYFDCRTVFYQRCSNTMNNLHVMFYVNGLTRYVILPPHYYPGKHQSCLPLFLAQLFIQLVASWWVDDGLRFPLSCPISFVHCHTPSILEKNVVLDKIWVKR